MKRIGTAVAAAAFTLAMAAGTPAVSAASTTASTTAMPAVAQVTAAGPVPSVKWLCGKPVIKKLIPACSHGRWELTTIKKMRCLQGHAPYVGWTGPSKLSYWAMRCFKTSEWEKW
ncbi:hypothetical protein [Nonomuraea sp. NPDC050643]|uniref:hypothetical protein n=1 Tax=Nonomuraea sp. NPDC050643 TaxID=3155660 RepID=UPI0033C94ADC